MGRLDARIVRLSARASFQRFAFSFPLTRGVARRRAGALFDLVAGFVHAQVLAACVELDLFSWTAARPRSATELSEHAGLPLDAAGRLLDAAAALRLLVRTGERYAPGRVGAPLAGPGGAGVLALIAHHGALYRDLADPLAFLRQPDGRTALQAFWPYSCAVHPCALTAAEVAPYSAVMSASQDFIAADVLDAFRDRGRGRWLDMGGGDGAFLAEAARRHPRLRGLLLDLPPVAELASARFAREELCDRMEARSGDIRRDAPDGGFSAVFLLRILHDHGDEDARRILAAARRAMAPRGRLVIAEPMRGRREDARVTDAYFGLYLLAMGQGRLRTPAEIAALAHAAGFARVQERPTRRSFLTRVLVAQG